MSEMIERVAKAIAPLAWSDLAEQTWKGEAMREARTEARKMARAAIEAMREPTKKMVDVGYTEINNNIDSWNYESDSGYSVEDIAPTATWRAMIDAALKK